MGPRHDERLAAMRAIYASSADRMSISFERFAELSGDWEFEPVRVCGAIVGAVMMRGAEIHAGVVPEARRRWLGKGLIRRTLARIVSEHGHAWTRVQEANAAGHAFVRRFGFELCGTEDGAAVYILKGRQHV